MTGKRIFDVVFSAIGIVVLTPLYLITATAIRLDTSGPVFFRQYRVGKAGVAFRIHKFRTMHVIQEAGSQQITVGRDSRITRVGHLLRKTKIDELPQLIDVFIGSMSFVGPRPEVPKYVEFYPDHIRNIVLSVRPGITDECSLKFIDESDLLAAQPNPEHFYINEIIPIKISYHVTYVNNRSMIGDIAIIISTIRSMLR